MSRPALQVIAAGAFTSLQDIGRPGYLQAGHPGAGALDQVSMRLANLLVGNHPTEGVLEAFYLGPHLRVDADSVRMACVSSHASIDFKSMATGLWKQMPLSHSFIASRGDELRCRTLIPCSTLYLAVEGGFDVTPVMGSVSTFARGQYGGFDGRPLQSQDRLPLRLGGAAIRCEKATTAAVSTEHHIRVVLGPQDDYFTAEGLLSFASSAYRILPSADRMAMRLEGEILAHPRGYDITSDAIAPGSIQIAGDGQPIILLADRQTTGGYPKIATVISADMAKLGRLAIGEDVRFEAVDFQTAVEARREFLLMTSSLALTLVEVKNRSCVAESDALLSENLISGVVSAEAVA